MLILKRSEKAVWQNRLHDGLRDPLHPGRAFTPNEKYAALTETAGYVPLVSVSGCPDILAAERQARHLLRSRTIEQLIYSKIQAPAGQDDHAWKRRTLALIETNPRQVTESSAQALFQAAAYPEAITAAAGGLHRPAKLAQGCRRRMQRART